ARMRAMKLCLAGRLSVIRLLPWCLVKKRAALSGRSLAIGTAARLLRREYRRVGNCNLQAAGTEERCEFRIGFNVGRHGFRPRILRSAGCGQRDGAMSAFGEAGERPRTSPICQSCRDRRQAEEVGE